MAKAEDISNIVQAFYRYELWEDFQSGMYNQRSNSESIQKAVECLSDERACRDNMQKVVNEWKIAAAQVLTNPESNGRAWLGQCACFMYAGCHDEETRKAWVLLPLETQKTANHIADEVIYSWLADYAKSCPNYQLSIFDTGE